MPTVPCAFNRTRSWLHSIALSLAVPLLAVGCSKSESPQGAASSVSPGAPATAPSGGPKQLAVTETEVTVGQLHSATGTMAISETGSIQAEQLRLLAI